MFSGSKLLPALQKTISTVFGSELTSSGEILASNVALITSKEAIAERAKNSPASRLPNLPRYIASLQPVDRVEADVPLLTDDYAPVDLLVRKRR